MRRILPFVGITFFLATTTALAGDWPSWRGPTGQGISDEKDLPLTWGGKDDANILWKVALPGVEAKATQDHNQSSPIVSKGRVFVTTSFWPKGVKQGEAIAEHHVICYQATDGKQLWDKTVEPGPWKLTDLRGGYTVATPAADGERVYVVFGSSVIAAFDYDGKSVWRKEIKPFDFDVTAGSSPIVYEDTVLYQCDQKDGAARLLAYDRKNGDVKWEAKRPKQGFTHSTPTLVKIKGKTQLLVAASDALQGVDPTNGKILWWCDAEGDTVSPIYGNGVVYLDSGRGSTGVAVDPTGEGNVTKTNRKWKVSPVSEGFSSPAIVGDYLYRLHSPGMVMCLKLETGDKAFDERLSGVSTAASPIVTADGRLYFASAGKSFVVKAGPKLEILATNDLGEGGDASPAVADGRIYLKGGQHLFCIGKKR